MPLDIDRFAKLESPLQRWDPRIKLFTLGIFIFSVALLKTLPIAIIAFFIAVCILRLSSLPYDFIASSLKWIIFFLLPFFIIMPLSYPGEPAFKVIGLPFAWEGLQIASLIFIKAVAIVLTTFSMFGTARFDVSMIALQHLKCPKIMVQMLLFTYRYTFVFIEEMRRMQIAMRARGFVIKSNLNTMHIMGNFVGTLLVRSFERSERVYKAMLSKGYQGELHSMVKFHSNRQDYIKSALILTTSILMLAVDFSGLFLPAKQAWF